MGKRNRLVEADFMTLIHDFDKTTTAIFADERIRTLSDWLRIGKRLADAMRDESSVPTKYAPERFRTRAFRDLAQDFGNIVESAATVTFDKISDFLHGIGEALKVIIEVSERMQGICRWYPPTSEARSRRRRWLQGCEDVDEAPRQRVLVEARRMERHAQRRLTRQSPALRYKPATLPRVGLSPFRRPITPPARQSPTRANVARSGASADALLKLEHAADVIVLGEAVFRVWEPGVVIGHDLESEPVYIEVDVSLLEVRSVRSPDVDLRKQSFDFGPCRLSDALAVRGGIYEKNIQGTFVRLFIDNENKSSDNAPITQNAVSPRAKGLKACKDGLSGYDFAIFPKMRIAQSELLGCAVSEGLLVVANELIAVAIMQWCEIDHDQRSLPLCG